MRSDRLTFLLCALTIFAASSAPAGTRPGHVNNGQALYQRHCLQCHGAALDGKGPKAASLRVRPPNFYTYLSRVKGDLELEVTIRRGRESTAMHDWDPALTDAEIDDLIAYIRSAVPRLEVKP